LLFLPGNSCIVLQLQLWLVRFSHSKVGQFSFEYRPHSHKTSSAIHHSPHLGGLLLSHPCSQPLLLFLPSFTESLSPCPTSILCGRFRVHPSSTVCVRLQFTVYAFQLFEGIQSSLGHSTVKQAHCVHRIHLLSLYHLCSKGTIEAMDSCFSVFGVIKSFVSMSGVLSLWSASMKL
jgi:hypothetical protein